MKRGVELSMNVIIIAAIALIVLVILILLVTRSGTSVQEGTNCQSLPQGTCVNPNPQPGADPCDVGQIAGRGYVRSSAPGCTGTQVCCYKPL